MSEILKEEDISMGFRSPDYAKTVAMPLCSVCKNIAVGGKCLAFGKRPEEYMDGERYDCPYVEIDTGAFSFPTFLELYPDIVERLRQKKQP